MSGKKRGSRECENERWNLFSVHDLQIWSMNFQDREKWKMAIRVCNVSSENLITNLIIGLIV